MEEQASSNFLIGEKEIVKMAKKDDRSFEILYNHYFPKIYSFVIKRVGSREIAEDIVSDVFMKAFTKMDTYEIRKCTFGAWLYKIANNTVIDHYRKEGKKKSVSIEEGANLPDKSPTMSEGVDISFKRETIEVAMKEIPEKYQKIIQLKFFSELSNGDIAEVMGISVNNAGVLLYRALKKFKTHFEKYS